MQVFHEQEFSDGVIFVVKNDLTNLIDNYRMNGKFIWEMTICKKFPMSFTKIIKFISEVNQRISEVDIYLKSTLLVTCNIFLSLVHTLIFL